MIWTMYDTWIVTVGALAAMACALVGCFLLMRRMSMMGDAISHAVLPGLAAAFIFTGSRDSSAMFVGAAVVGLLTAVFTQSIHKWGRVEESAAMGVVFTTLFAIGLILIRQAADHVDLDPSCVLTGAIEVVPWDMRAVAGIELPRAAWTIGTVLVLNAIVVTLLWKELKISAFDPALATTLGINATFMHYLLMVLVAVTTVACFEAVGSILVIAMLIVPGAVAYLLTERLKVMVVISLVVGVASAVLGHVSAIVVPGWFGFVDTTTAGMMATVAGFIFLVTFLLAPRHGIISKLITRFNLSLQIIGEDMLGMLYRIEESEVLDSQRVQLEHFAEALDEPTWKLRRALRRLRRKRLLVISGGAVKLTDVGRHRASDIIRSHRLWETYVEQLISSSRHQQHFSAEMLEHVTDAKTQADLAQTVGEPSQDPQGKDIPG